MPKKNIGSVMEMLRGIIISGEQLKSIPNLPNECSIKNYTQLANLCYVKVKQEFELIMLDISYICQHIYKGTNKNYSIINKKLTHQQK